MALGGLHLMTCVYLGPWAKFLYTLDQRVVGYTLVQRAECFVLSYLLEMSPRVPM